MNELEFIISDKGRLLVKRIKFILLLLTCSGNKVSKRMIVDL